MSKPSPSREGVSNWDESCSESELSDTEQFVADVGRYFNSELLSDVTLLVKSSETGCTRQFNAHKFVLAKSSEFFRALLYSDNWKPGIGLIRELVEDEVCYRAFEHFLRFLYTGKVGVNRESAVGLLRLSDKYAIRSLRGLTESYMMQNAEPPRVQNALLWYSWAKHLSLTELADVCFNTICWNVEKVIRLEEFLECDVEFLVDLLEADSLVIEDENAVLRRMLLPWLAVNDRFNAHVHQLLPMIRFPMMDAKQLFQLEQSDLLNNSECGSQLQSLINKAYRFRSLCPSVSESDAGFNGPRYRPRHYLSLEVDSVKVGNTMRFGFQVDIRTQQGPVPSSHRESEWKILYQKSCESWSFKLMSQETSVATGGSSLVQLAVLARNEYGDIVQCHVGDLYAITRGSQLYQLSCDIYKRVGINEAKNLLILLKQLPSVGKV